MSLPGPTPGVAPILSTNQLFIGAKAGITQTGQGDQVLWGPTVPNGLPLDTINRGISLAYQNFAALPVSAPTGAIAYTIDEDTLWVYNGTQWSSRSSVNELYRPTVSNLTTTPLWATPSILSYPNGFANYHPFKDSIRFTPFTMNKRTVIDRVQIQVTVLGAGSLLRLGIYRSTNQFGIPSTLVADLGDIDSSTTGLKTITVSLTFDPNAQYWFALNCNQNATPSVAGVQSTGVLGFGVESTTHVGVANYNYPLVYAAMPQNVADGNMVLGGTANDPVIAVRIVSQQ